MFERPERIVQRVSGPGQLPGAKIGVPILLVEVPEDKKNEERHSPGNQN